MKNLVKISRENLKSLNGGASGPACPDDPQFGMCYPPGWPKGICMPKYQCCIQIGFPEEVCREQYT